MYSLTNNSILLLMPLINTFLAINKLIINFALIAMFCKITEALLTTFEPKDDIHFEIIEPESLRYTFRTKPAQNFGTHFKSSYSNINLVIVEPNDSCSTIVNRLELQNNIGLIERGGCSFLAKCIEAELNGMIAIIIYDNNDNNDDIYIEMIGDDTTRNCSIPAAFLLGRDGYMIRRALEALQLNRAIINIPINASDIPMKKRQPPWVVW